MSLETEAGLWGTRKVSTMQGSRVVVAGEKARTHWPHIHVGTTEGKSSHLLYLHPNTRTRLSVITLYSARMQRTYHPDAPAYLSVDANTRVAIHYATTANNILLLLPSRLPHWTHSARHASQAAYLAPRETTIRAKCRDRGSPSFA